MGARGSEEQPVPKSLPQSLRVLLPAPKQQLARSRSPRRGQGPQRADDICPTTALEVIRRASQRTPAQAGTPPEPLRRAVYEMEEAYEMIGCIKRAVNQAEARLARAAAALSEALSQGGQGQAA